SLSPVRSGKKRLKSLLRTGDFPPFVVTTSVVISRSFWEETTKVVTTNRRFSPVCSNDFSRYLTNCEETTKVVTTNRRFSPVCSNDFSRYLTNCEETTEVVTTNRRFSPVCSNDFSRYLPFGITHLKTQFLSSG
ncbi:MAG: hypothetical protein ACRC8Y_03770, partial [Chroococcales cyanobacterium]